MQWLQSMTCAMRIISNWRAWSSGIGSCMRTLRPAAVQLPKQGSAWSQDCLKSGNRGPLRMMRGLNKVTKYCSNAIRQLCSAMLFNMVQRFSMLFNPFSTLFNTFQLCSTQRFQPFRTLFNASTPFTAVQRNAFQPF